MDFYANEGKSVTIQANGKTYARHAITTHFVQVGELYRPPGEICHTSLPTGRYSFRQRKSHCPMPRAGGY